MKTTVILTNNPQSIMMLRDLMENQRKIDRVIFYSKNIDMQALYHVEAVRDVLKENNIPYSELKGDIDSNYFRGAVLINP